MRKVNGYVAQLADVLRMTGIEPGDLVDVIVLHDDDCAALRGEACRCRPRVELFGRDADGNPMRYTVDEDGRLETQA